jgi:hypothetical protein
LTNSEYMKDCIECARGTRWPSEALARAQYHLSQLYQAQGIEEAEARRLEKEALRVLDSFKGFGSECVRDSDDIFMIFDDLQPTFDGRYTGTTLLRRVQEWSKAKRAQPGAKLAVPEAAAAVTAEAVTSVTTAEAIATATTAWTGASGAAVGEKAS